MGFLDRRLGRVEHGGGRLGGCHDVRRAATRRLGDSTVCVAKGERLVLHPGHGHGSDPRFGAERIDRPVRETLRQMHRRVGADSRRGGDELAAGEIDPRAGRAARVAPDEREIERVFPEREADRSRGRLEGHVHPSDAGGAPGPLQVRDRRHDPIGERRRLVLFSLTREVEHGHALLLPVGSRRERGVVIAYDELVVVADRGAGEIVRVRGSRRRFRPETPGRARARRHARRRRGSGRERAPSGRTRRPPARPRTPASGRPRDPRSRRPPPGPAPRPARRNRAAERGREPGRPRARARQRRRRLARVNAPTPPIR